MSDLRGFYAYHPEPSRIIPREASVKVFSGMQGQKYTTFNFLMYDDDNGILISLPRLILRFAYLSTCLEARCCPEPEEQAWRLVGRV